MTDAYVSLAITSLLVLNFALAPLRRKKKHSNSEEGTGSPSVPITAEQIIGAMITLFVYFGALGIFVLLQVDYLSAFRRTPKPFTDFIPSSWEHWFNIRGNVPANIVAIIIVVVLYRYLSHIIWKIYPKKAMATTKAALPLAENWKENLLLGVHAIFTSFGEETFFRMAFPILVYLVFHNVALSFVAAAIAFGLVHLPRGSYCFFATMIFAFLLSGLYVVTGSIVCPMITHALYNMIFTIYIPWRKNLVALAKQAEADSGQVNLSE